MFFLQFWSRLQTHSFIHYSAGLCKTTREKDNFISTFFFQKTISKKKRLLHTIDYFLITKVSVQAELNFLSNKITKTTMTWWLVKILPTNKKYYFVYKRKQNIKIIGWKYLSWSHFFCDENFINSKYPQLYCTIRWCARILQLIKYKLKYLQIFAVHTAHRSKYMTHEMTISMISTSGFTV